MALMWFRAISVGLVFAICHMMQEWKYMWADVTHWFPNYFNTHEQKVFCIEAEYTIGCYSDFIIDRKINVYGM